MKTCSKCGMDKGPGEFKMTHRQCKACHASQRAEYYQQNKEKIMGQQAQYRIQNPDLIKTQKSDSYQRNKEKIGELQAKYYQDNKDEVLARNAEYRRLHPEEIRAGRSEYRRQHPDKEKAWQSKWRSNNSDKIRAKNARYYQENPEKYLEWVHARRARLRGNGGTFTSNQILELVAAQKYKCANPKCRKSIKDKFHRDHMQPIVLGGSNGISNIQLLCPKCNHKKHDMPYEEWCRETGQLCFLPVN